MQHLSTADVRRTSVPPVALHHPLRQITWVLVREQTWGVLIRAAGPREIPQYYFVLALGIFPEHFTRINPLHFPARFVCRDW